MSAAVAIVAAARATLGTRWMHQGRLPGVGLDCVGLVVVAARGAGIELPHVPDYGRLPDGPRLRAAIEASATRVALAQAAPGDVALMAFDRWPIHLGVLADYPGGGLALIHAWAGARRVVEHRLDAAWAARIQAVYRLAECA
jgi:cell wall-associated NlpC family hydrolase